MKTDLKISNYVILFEYNGIYLLYSSKNNLFLELNKDLYDDLYDFQNGINDAVLKDQNLVKILKAYHVIGTDMDDKVFLNQMILDDHIRSFNSNDIFITFAPTIWCNLKCPYCYETKKSRGIVDEEICDKIIEFLGHLKSSKRLHLCWYGGEPLIGINRIEYFLNKLEQTDINLVEHSIVTNGTLFNNNVINTFRKYPLNSIQITLDGLKEKHDKVRIHHDNRGSFDEIIHNLDLIVKELPNTHISIRVNTGKHNKSDFIEIDKMMRIRYCNNKKILVYPGILTGDNDCGFTSNFFSSDDLSKFHSSIISKGEENTLPENLAKGCTANYINGFVIGPKGELYKCWDDIGFIEREIGSVVDNCIRNKELLQNYMIYSSFRDDKKCLSCKLLPNCFGGCPHHRLENRFEGKHKNLCHHFGLKNHKTLKETLYRYYLKQKSQKANNKIL